MEMNKNLRFFFALLLTILYCIAGTLLMSIIMNINHKFADYYYAVASVVNIVIGLIVIALLWLFKKRITKVSFKSFTYGLFVYGLPLMLFYIYHIFTSVKWIFTEGTDYCQEQFKSMLLIIGVYYLTVGFAEEMVFRSGFLTYLLSSNNQYSKARVAIACMYSAILFGAVHLMSLFTEPEKGVSKIVITVILGTLIGYVYGKMFMTKCWSVS